MAVQPHPEPLTKLFRFCYQGWKEWLHPCSRAAVSKLSPLPCLCLASFRQVHQPAAASHALRSTCAQERSCTWGKVWGTVTHAQAGNSAGLTHSGFTPESAAATSGKKAPYKPSGSGGAGGAGPKGTATPVSCSKRRGLCTAE